MYFQKIQTTLLEQHYQTPPKGPFGNVTLITMLYFLKIRVDEKMYENTCNII